MNHSYVERLPCETFFIALFSCRWKILVKFSREKRFQNQYGVQTFWGRNRSIDLKWITSNLNEVNSRPKMCDSNKIFCSTSKSISEMELFFYWIIIKMCREIVIFSKNPFFTLFRLSVCRNQMTWHRTHFTTALKVNAKKKRHHHKNLLMMTNECISDIRCTRK